MTSVEAAAKEGNLAFIKNHVNKENVNQTFDTGRTVVHLAAEHGHADILQFLIDKGADFESPDIYGIRPLLSAVWEEHKECVKILLAKGAERNLIAVDGTPLIECTRDPEIRQMLQN